MVLVEFVRNCESTFEGCRIVSLDW